MAWPVAVGECFSAKLANTHANNVLKYLRWRNTDSEGISPLGYRDEVFDMVCRRSSAWNPSLAARCTWARRKLWGGCIRLVVEALACTCAPCRFELDPRRRSCGGCRLWATSGESGSSSWYAWFNLGLLCGVGTGTCVGGGRAASGLVVSVGSWGFKGYVGRLRSG